jgi:radical SAM-linked protein
MTTGSLPAFDPAAPMGSTAADPAAYREPAKGAAYRQKAMPDLPAASRRASVTPDDVHRHRLTFEKRGDARLLSHRNTMDVLERGIRAAGLPARYSEGFNPHMKLSMGPALPLGLESRHEVFDLETLAPLPHDAADRINAKLPPGVRVLEVRPVAIGEEPLSKAVRGARYAVRLQDPAQVSRAASALEGASARVPALRALALEETAEGAKLTFEVNLDQSAGETATARKVLEALLEIPPEAQLALSVTREATVLS